MNKSYYLFLNTDHKNLTYKNFNTDRVIRWRLIIEEYGPNLKYIEGPKNIVADALSRLGLKDNPDFKDMLEQCNFYESQVMAVDDQPVIKTIPIDLKVIKEQQDIEKCAEKLLGTDKRFNIKNFHGAGILGQNGTNLELICYSNRIVVPKTLQMKILE